MHDIHRKVVLDKGFIALEAELTSDLSVVNAAKVSFNKQVPVLDEAGEKIIAFLMKNKHGTPFEHNYFRFRVKAPLFVFREWHRHRVGHSYNECSGRYSELENEFYIPENVRTQVGKPGAYSYEPASEHLAHAFQHQLDRNCVNSFDAYQAALNNGIAKEQARFLLPVNLYSQMIWSCNARSLMHFLNLRAEPHAMWEIRQYAYAAEGMFAERMPVTYKAWNENGRVAP